MNTHVPVTGFVLAGGQSSRMGREKAWLPLGPHALIEAVIEQLRPHVPRVVAIGNQQNVGRLRTLSVDAAAADFWPGYGPLMGLYTGLMHTDTPLNLFVPCDMPRLDGRLIQRLCLAWRPGTALVAGVEPDGRLQPFPLLCHVSACRRIGALLDRRDAALQRLRELPGAELVSVGSESVPPNLNTPEDYERYCVTLTR